MDIINLHGVMDMKDSLVLIVIITVKKLVALTMAMVR
jgi:hypothetical protein